MGNLIKKLKKRSNIIIFIFFITFLLYFVSVCLFTNSLLELSGIENILRYSLIIILFVSITIHFFYNLVKITDRKYVKSIVINLITFIFSLVLLFGSSFINVVFDSISNINESSTLNYTTKLITLTDTDFNSKSSIGIIKDEDDIEGYVLAKSLIKEKKLKNEIVYYDTYHKMLVDLLDGNIDSIFVKNNYISLYSSEELFSELGDQTKVIYKKSEKLKNDDIVSGSNKTFDEPITILLLGVDSDVDGLNDSAAFNGDTIMLMTFNPDTLNATMFSLPRDLMVPIACNNNNVAKINSSAAGGTACVIDTIKNLTGISVDYFAKINFKGVVDLVDALGGINVEVEEPYFDKYNGQVCEQNSDRKFGSSLICMNPGNQKLNGEQALAYARNRKQYLFSDIDRINHQQQVIASIASEAMKISSYGEFESLLNAVEKNVVTNMSTSQMLSAYDVFKDVVINALSGEDLINIEKSHLEYYDLRVYMPSYGMETSGLGYYQDSLDDIVKMMETNLGIIKPEIEKSFSFKIDEVYESKISGEKLKGEISFETLKDFTGSSKSKVQTYCNEKKLKCNFVTVDSENSNYNSSVSSDLVGKQSVRYLTLLELVKEVTFYINGEVIKDENPEVPQVEKPEVPDTNIDSDDNLTDDNENPNPDLNDEKVDDLILPS